MLHKLLIAVAVLFSAFALYAQKPVTAAVSDIEDDPANGLEMCRSLFNEYFLSELTTHAKINMMDTASIQKSVAELNLPRGRDLTEKEIKDLCAKLKTDAICLVKMSRGSKNVIDVSVKIVDNKAKTAGTVSASMKGIGDTDSTSHSMARECAHILRKMRGIEIPAPMKPQ
ncbi:MAG: hypothetical protein IJH79_19445 [Lentisphaeria bacterium]|nr:hypothetical protein [Lentisphaeria bacterium]